MTKESPIAVFDSGVGGISVLRRLCRLMPEEDFIYFGDSANAPYGTKTKEEIFELTHDAVRMFLAGGAKAIVLACNTATSAAAKRLREMYSGVPIIGLEPALKPAALSAEHPSVLVLATPLTLREEKFALLMDRFKDEAEILLQEAPDIVRYVENDMVESEELMEYLRELLAPYRKRKVDAVVLGCTHFPFCKRKILEALGGSPAVFDGAQGAAQQTRRLLENSSMLRDGSGRKGKIIFEDSDPEKTALEKKLFFLPSTEEEKCTV